MPVLRLLRLPPRCVEAQRAVPEIGVGMDCVERRNEDLVGWEAVAAGDDNFLFCGPAGLVGGVVDPLRLFDEFVEVGEGLDELRVPVGLAVDVVIDKFLEEAVLLAGVCDH